MMKAQNQLYSEGIQATNTLCEHFLQSKGGESRIYFRLFACKLAKSLTDYNFKSKETHGQTRGIINS